MQKVREILREHGMNQMQLAAAARISVFRLSRLFNERAQLRTRDKRRIAEALGVARDALFPRRRHRRR